MARKVDLAVHPLAEHVADEEVAHLDAVEELRAADQLPPPQQHVPAKRGEPARRLPPPTGGGGVRGGDSRVETPRSFGFGLLVCDLLQLQDPRGDRTRRRILSHEGRRQRDAEDVAQP